MKIPLLLCVILASIAAWPVKATAQDANAQPGKQTEHSLATSDGGKIDYLLYLPRTYGEKPAPMMLFLHGRGESDGPLSLVAKWGPPMTAARGDDLPYVLVSPQCPRDVHGVNQRSKSDGSNC